MATPKSRRRGRSGMELLLRSEWVRGAASLRRWPACSRYAPGAGLPRHDGERRVNGPSARGALALPALSPNQWIVKHLTEQGEDRAQNGRDAEEERRDHQQHIEAE